jgi:hypothetical protein
VTDLVVEELKTTLTQNFDIDVNRRFTIEAIAPYIYIHSAPAGTFTFKIKDGATTLASNTFTSASIQAKLSTSNTYAHIWEVIQFTDLLHLTKKTYTLELSSSGYTYSRASFIGWIRPHENIYNTTDGLNDSINNNPMGFRLYERKRVNHG